MEQKRSFGNALAKVRKQRGLTQEDFVPVSGRTYISALECGQKSPTLEKVAQLAAVLEVNPLVLCALSLAGDQESSPEDQLREAKRQLNDLDLSDS